MGVKSHDKGKCFGDGCMCWWFCMGIKTRVMMMNACAKEVDFLQMQDECAWLKMHVKACELNGCGWLQ